jgi:CxxC motif-containing protein (DUF1111 family)
LSTDFFTGSLWRATVAGVRKSHLESAVAADEMTVSSALYEGCSNGCGNRSPWCQRLPEAISMMRGLVELGCPHLVLANVGSTTMASPPDLVELVDDLLHTQAALLR